MNENVTIKTPKRRRWIARLLVSALCILLASSLLFVSVVAENVNTISYGDEPFVSTADGTYLVGCYFRLDDTMSYCVAYRTSSNIRITRYDVNTMTALGYYDMSILSTDTMLTVGCSDDFCWYLYSSGSDGNISLYLDVYSYATGFVDAFYLTGGNISFTDPYKNLCYYSSNGYAVFVRYKIGDTSYYTFYESNGSYEYSGLAGFVYGNSSWNVCFTSADTPAFNLDGNYFYSNNQGLSFSGLYTAHSGYRTFSRTATAFSYNEYLLSSEGVLTRLQGVFKCPISPRLGILFFRTDFPSSSSFNGTLVGIGQNYTSIKYVLATSSEYTPPESSDETTTEPPPESSEESSVGGVIDLYSYDKLSDGTYESALIGTLDLTDATGLRVFLGMYLLGDNVWSDIKTPLTLLVYREDGSLDTYTYDYYAAGFAWGSGSPGSFTFPKFIGGYFDIPLSSSSELYFASSAPGGTIWLQNNSVVLRQINLLNSDSYVELENVSAEECIISVYDSLSDEDPESYVYTSGVLKYTLRKRNSSSSIPVSLDYGETGIVHGVMKYNGADFTVSSIILASDPDLMPPIYDFESMDNALSQAYDDVSRQQYLENLLTSYIENAYGTVSYDPDTSGAFLGGVDLMGDIVDSSGGSTIISAFVNMWSIHPFFPAMVGLLGTFLIFSFFLRKA